MLATDYGNFGSILLGLLGIGISVLLFLAGIFTRSLFFFWIACFTSLLNAGQLFLSLDSAKDGDRQLTLVLVAFSIASGLFCLFTASWRKKRPSFFPESNHSPPNDQ